MPASACLPMLAASSPHAHHSHCSISACLASASYNALLSLCPRAALVPSSNLRSHLTFSCLFSCLFLAQVGRLLSGQFSVALGLSSRLGLAFASAVWEGTARMHHTELTFKCKLSFTALSKSPEEALTLRNKVIFSAQCESHF